MAEEELKTEDAPKKSKKMLIIIIAAVLVLGGGAGAYFFLFAGGDEPVAEGEQPEAQATEAAPMGEAVYVAMPRPFQFNAPGMTRERLVQIDVQLMVRGVESEDLARKHIPMLEGNLLQVFSASNADDLVTENGKRELKERATAQVRQVMNELEGKPIVEEILFTGFVIQ